MATGKDSTTRLLEILTGFLGFVTGLGFIVDMVPQVKYDMNAGLYGAFGIVVGALTTYNGTRRREGKNEQAN